MASRIVLFGATGYTGRLTAERLVADGAQPLLAARDSDKLAELSAELGGAETAVADVQRPETVRALVSEGDVLVTTVGPFLEMGRPAVDAAVDAKAIYIDSTGEPAFIRSIFERHGPRAAGNGAALLTAMGYDYVPGNLAGALALERAGERAVRVDVGYYGMSASRDALSGGTVRSLATAMLEPGFAYRDGGVVTERAGATTRSFEVRGSDRRALSIGGSEHFALPRLHGALTDVRTFVGMGPLAEVLKAVTAAQEAALKLPGAKRVAETAVDRLLSGSTGGPDADTRARGSTHIVAIAYDDAHAKLAEVQLSGVETYTLTAGLLSWAARRAARHGTEGEGALGPVDGFGLGALRDGAAEAGLTPV